jgi:hypothetical protein
MGPPRSTLLLGDVASSKDVMTLRSAVLLEQDVCYLSVLLQLRYKEQFRHVYTRDYSQYFFSEELFVNFETLRPQKTVSESLVDVRRL